MFTIKVREVCEILNGFAFKSDNYVNSGIRIIRIANVQKGYIEDNTPVFYPVNSTGVDKYILEEGDLLMSLTGNVGRVAILEKKFLPAALNQRVACLRLKNSYVLKKYLFYIFNSNYFEQQCIQSSQGIAQKNLSTEWLKDYEIPVYNLNEQKKIVTVLDKVSQIISNRKQQIQQMDELVKARFVEMFGTENYPLIRLGDICSKITDGTHKTPNYLDDGVTFISAKNIINGELDFSDIKHISEEEYQEIQNRCQTEMYDILLSKSGSLGTPVIVKTDEKLGLFESLAVIKYDREQIIPEFLCEQLKSDRIQRQFKAGTKGVAIKHLHLGVIADTKIIVPTIDEQRQFAAFVAQTDKSKAAIQKSLDETQLLFDSLMQKYFG